MEKETKEKREFPSSDALKAELERTKEKGRRRLSVRNRVFLLITVAAIAILAATFVMPVFRIYGTSMTPTLKEGDIVAAVKKSHLKRGDLVAFYYNNKVLVKRVIATEGQWVNMDKEGNVYVNDMLLDEPYLEYKSLGDPDVQFPYQVPEGRLFVLGDHRDGSADSRMEAMGAISESQIAGKLVLRIWPLGADMILVKVNSNMIFD